MHLRQRCVTEKICKTARKSQLLVGHDSSLFGFIPLSTFAAALAFVADDLHPFVWQGLEKQMQGDARLEDAANFALARKKWILKRHVPEPLPILKAPYST
jgi:hypothetical protein